MSNIRTLALLYKGHLRSRPLSELLALLGIAAAVALLFAVQVANKSIVGSYNQLSHGIAGRASLEVASRSSAGFNQGLFHKVERLSDVGSAAPVLERRVAIKGPKGSRSLTLVGIDDRLSSLGGALAKGLARRYSLSQMGLYLTRPSADAIGAIDGSNVTVEVGERTVRVPVVAAVDEGEIGTLVQSPVAVMPLGFAQEVVGAPGRINRILVAPVPGHLAQAKAALRKVAGGSLNVRPSDSEAMLLAKAAAPDRQSGTLFSVISLLVGVLLAYNAMLLAVMQRRRVVASLHMLGASDKTIVASLIFDALVLGLLGSALGVFFGDLISRFVMHQVPSFLTSAFAIGNQRVVGPETVAISIAAGVLAALAAAARPALTMIKVGPQEALPERGTNEEGRSSLQIRRRFFWGGLLVTALSVAGSILVPAVTLASAAGVVVGMLMVLPSIVTYLLNAMLALARRTSSAVIRVSLGELVSSPARATALAGVGALAVFAIMTITGPTRDIERGMRQLTANFFNNADLWVTVGGSGNSTGTLPFDQSQLVRRIERLQEVRQVREYRSSFLDLGTKRVWVIGESPAARDLVAPSQIVDGNAGLATRRLRSGGWAAITESLAKEWKVAVGQEFAIPTPAGVKRFKLAATVTNYGWPLGVIVMNSKDYASSWNSSLASALEVDLQPGIALPQGRNAVQQALGQGSPLTVRTVDERRAETESITSQGFARLNQIANMVLVAAILAVVAVMLGSVWQRRSRMWSLMSLGMSHGELYRTVFFETGFILMLGCLTGVVFGSIGQAVGGRYIHLTSSYPVPYEPAWGLALTTLILATVLAMVAVALPVRMLFMNKRVPLLSTE